MLTDARHPGSKDVRTPVWQAIHSFLIGIPGRLRGQPSRTPRRSRAHIVALVVNDEERNLLASLSNGEQWDMHLVPSYADAWTAANRWHAAVILYDRDWPDTEWRAAVQNLASCSPRTCVILTSRVIDDYLRDELIRKGGYDVLAKPLRADDVVRVIKLALSYWRSGASMALKGPMRWRSGGS